MAEPFIGEICIFGFNFAPVGWALSNGQLISVNQNSALFALLGTTYGGDGRTTFGIPDLQGRMPIGMGNGAGLTPRIIGTKAGQENATLTANQLAAHTHPATFTPSSASTPVNICIPAVGGSNGTTNVPSNTVELSNAGTSDRSPLPVNIYSNATANTTLKPFQATVPATTGTVAVAANTPTASPVPLMNPFLALNFCIALTGLFPSRA